MVDSTSPRWKGKQFSDIAKAHPMSSIVEQLRTSLLQCRAPANLKDHHALLEVAPPLAELLNRSCFGQPISTAEEDQHWFQLSLEEAFYLTHALKCLVIIGSDGNPKTNEELWVHAKQNRVGFPYLYKAFFHMRNKNWILRPGLQYGVDFVAYRHHPSLVHSEYAVVVIAEDDPTMNHRLRTWSDWQCALRVSGGVAKTLLVLNIYVHGGGTLTSSISCLEDLVVEERVVSRWVPELSREVGCTVDKLCPKRCSGEN